MFKSTDCVATVIDCVGTSDELTLCKNPFVKRCFSVRVDMAFLYSPASLKIANLIFLSFALSPSSMDCAIVFKEIILYCLLFSLL